MGFDKLNRPGIGAVKIRDPIQMNLNEERRVR